MFYVLKSGHTASLLPEDETHQDVEQRFQFTQDGQVTRIKSIYLFIYSPPFWLRWVFVAAHGILIVVASLVEHRL